jgi:hypothetical protein
MTTIQCNVQKIVINDKLLEGIRHMTDISDNAGGLSQPYEIRMVLLNRTPLQPV